MAVGIGVLFVVFLLVLVLSCCKVAGDADQWEEDHYGIRRS